MVCQQSLASRQGQSGLEFLAVTGIGMLLLLGVSFFLLSDSQTARDQAQVQQVQMLGAELLAQSRVVQAQGRNSWVTVEANIPPTVTGIYTVEDNTLMFDIKTANGIQSQPIFSLTPVKGWYVVGDRNYLYNASSVTIGGGVMNFKVTANGTAVVIYAQ